MHGNGCFGASRLGLLKPFQEALGHFLGSLLELLADLVGQFDTIGAAHGYEHAGHGAVALLVPTLAGFGPDPDVLLTDLSLPGLSGADLALRLDREHPGLKVLFMSGFADQGIELPSAGDGPVRHIAKPISRERLAAALDS